MTDPAELEALLARAVELEVKTATAEAALAGRPLTIDGAEDLADQAREKLEGEVDAELVADMEARLEAIDDELEAAELAGTLPGVDPIADWEAGSDDDPPAEGKALGGCSQCGSGDVDDLANGATQCGNCGWPISEAKGMDFDEPDDDPVEPAAPAEVKSGVELSEFELLRARRAAIED